MEQNHPTNPGPPATWYFCERKTIHPLCIGFHYSCNKLSQSQWLNLLFIQFWRSEVLKIRVDRTISLLAALRKNLFPCLFYTSRSYMHSLGLGPLFISLQPLLQASHLLLWLWASFLLVLHWTHSDNLR